MDKLYDFVAKHHKVLFGVSIFTSLMAVSVDVNQDGLSLIFADKPSLILYLVSLGLMLLAMLVYVDKRRIRELSDSIKKEIDDKDILAKSVPDLTSRQREIYDLILSGKSNKEIMSILYIEQSTLKTHINHLYKKLNIQSRKELKSKAL